MSKRMSKKEREEQLEKINELCEQLGGSAWWDAFDLRITTTKPMYSLALENTDNGIFAAEKLLAILNPNTPKIRYFMHPAQNAYGLVTNEMFFEYPDKETVVPGTYALILMEKEDTTWRNKAPDLPDTEETL